MSHLRNIFLTKTFVLIEHILKMLDTLIDKMFVFRTRKIAENLLHQRRVTAWCVRWSGRKIGPNFVENALDEAVIVRYLQMWFKKILQM